MPEAAQLAACITTNCHWAVEGNAQRSNSSESRTSQWEATKPLPIIVLSEFVLFTKTTRRIAVLPVNDGRDWSPEHSVYFIVVKMAAVPRGKHAISASMRENIRP